MAGQGRGCSLFWAMFGLVPVENVEIKWPAKGVDTACSG